MDTAYETKSMLTTLTSIWTFRDKEMSFMELPPTYDVV